MIDLTFLEQLTKGNRDKLNRYIKLYLDVVPETFARMEENIATEDWQGLAINAHSLKPQADYIGHSQLKDVLVEIELAVKNSSVKACPDLMEEALLLHKDAEKFLNKKLMAD